MSDGVPQGWTTATLGDVVQVCDDEREPINASEREARLAVAPTHQRFAYYGATGQVGWIDSYRSEGEHVLLGEDGAPFLDSLKPKAYLVNGRYWVNNHAHVLQGVPDVLENRFLCHQLNALDYHPFVTGSTRLKLTSGAMRQIPLQLPPFDEQVRIADALDEVLSGNGAAIAELEAAVRKLTQYRQSLLKAAVEGDLTAEWRASNPPQEAGAELLARILREEPSEPRATIADAAALPITWVWASAAQLCGFITKGTTPQKGTGDGEPKTVPFLRVTNLTHTGALDFADQVFVSQATHQEFLGRSRVIPGDVLMNIVGPPLGQVSLVPDAFPEWNVNQAIAIFRPVDGVSNLYLRVALLSPVALRWLKARAKTTAGQTNLTLELCRALPIPLPPLTEQVEIARLVDEGLEALDTLHAEIRQMLKLAAAQRQNILRAAFSGQLVPQDPTDEPASVLLERIRAERLGGDDAASLSGKSRRRRDKQSLPSKQRRESTIPG